MRAFQKDATSKSLTIFIRDTASSPVGQGKTGLAFNTASLNISYRRQGGSRVAITLVTQTVTGAFSSGGFVEIDAANMPGLYRLDLPNAAIATGADHTIIQWKLAGLVDDFEAIDLLDYDPNTAPSTVQNIVDGVLNEALASHTTAGTVGERVGRIPNAAAGANGGLPTVDANNAVKIQSGTGANQISLAAGLVTLAGVTHTGAVIPSVTTVTGNVNGNVGGSVGSVTGAVGSVTGAVTVGTNNDKTGYAISAAGFDPVLDSANIIETGLSLRGFFRLTGAALFGRASGLATATAVYNNAIANSKARITATVDVDGNRTAITADQT